MLPVFTIDDVPTNDTDSMHETDLLTGNDALSAELEEGPSTGVIDQGSAAPVLYFIGTLHRHHHVVISDIGLVLSGE
jgi:hypothetical protein